jgi:hypothetical protein
MKKQNKSKNKNLSKYEAIQIPVALNKKSLKLIKKYCLTAQPEIFLSFEDDKFSIILNRRERESMPYIR